MTLTTIAAGSPPPSPPRHSHVFLDARHERSERKTWAVIGLCGAMMIAEIVGGLAFGSIALVADGMHMSTHAGALLLAALAYSYARHHATDPRFTFGTGKLGDLAGFTSAVILAMIALLIGYEAIGRLFAPVAIRFGEAIPIACAGLAVNLASALLLSGGRDHQHHHHDPRGHSQGPTRDQPPEPRAGAHRHGNAFAEEHEHLGHAAHRDNNLRAAIIHVLADAAVSVLVIIGLLLSRAFGWRWTDPVAGIIGACVIASWSYGLIRDTGAVLLDINPDRLMADRLRNAVESDGDQLADLHLWRLGPGHLGAIISVTTTQAHDSAYYRAKLARFGSLSHLTIEVDRDGPPQLAAVANHGNG
jgi:cation diffusion facilitator family transporter